MTKYLPEGRLIYTYENKSLMSSPAALKEAMQTGRTLEARVLLCDKDHNLHVDLGCMRGIIPREECAMGVKDGSVRDIAIISRVNKPVSFKITGFENSAEYGPTATLSRRLLQAECMENYISALRPGDVITVKVAHIENFGVFCDIGAGIPALLPIDSISVSRIPTPAVRFSQNQEIRAVVREVDLMGRVLLSHKELLGTWAENASRFEAGQTVPGIVRSVERYGIFIELTPNLAGLAELSDGLCAGIHTSVFIKNIIPEKMKIKLVIVDSFNAAYPIPYIKYYTDARHIDRFVYSPPESEKLIETVFYNH
ncbi:MAG: S1 RNA-binding domain-containing protein [Oscillospiraceae bacterium]|nr:S1 RNA-binding domain-containing protein [Oscillospiraceae bacterium]